MTRVAEKLFKQHRSYSWFTKQLWQSIVCDTQFLDRVRVTPGLVSWSSDLSHILPIQKLDVTYAVLGVDGSQIYPDAHLEGVECFLINAGGCFLSYGSTSQAQLFSEPFVYVPEQCSELAQTIGFSAELVDVVREEHEFILMKQKAVLYASQTNDLFAALFDGNLLLWHLESKPSNVKEILMERYLAPLYEMYQQKIVCAGYLSAAKSKDIIRLLGSGLQGHKQYAHVTASLEEMTDAQILTHVLEPFERTTIFYCSSSIVELYPPQLKPCFFYLHVGSEIVRIEIPFWVTQMPECVDALAAMCIDQCAKGYGYPVALAEAHAQAVVQSADREFFYQLIHRMAANTNQHVRLSPKSFKKRMMSI